MSELPEKGPQSLNSGYPITSSGNDVLFLGSLQALLMVGEYSYNFAVGEKPRRKSQRQ